LFALGGLDVDVDVSDTAATKYPVPIHLLSTGVHVPGLVRVELRQ
jgi:hypothetical protein